MHHYKVHLPKQSSWDCDCDYEEWLGHSYTNGVNRDSIKREYLDEEMTKPSSLDEIPIQIDGNLN